MQCSAEALPPPQGKNQRRRTGMSDKFDFPFDCAQDDRGEEACNAALKRCSHPRGHRSRQALATQTSATMGYSY